MTDQCDLRCRYCRAGAELEAAGRALPSLDRLAAAVDWAVRRLGATRLKLTGGEPLLRSGVAAFVRRLAAGPGVREISMTTNGTRLAALAGELVRVVLSRVNVSLDTLDPVRFRDLTRGGAVERVVAGIDAAVSAGLSPVKLNAVLRRSSFEQDVPALLAFAAERGLEVRFIELMRTGPARRLGKHFGGVEVATGWIEPVSHSFCGGCLRLRLDARGDLRRCLMDPEPFELLGRLEAGEDADLEEDVDRFLAGKRAPVSFGTPRSMAAIGG